MLIDSVVRQKMGINMNKSVETNKECVVCCHRCVEILMESAIANGHMLCPGCGARLTINVKNGKVSVFDDTRSAEELALKRHAHLAGYAARLKSRATQ